MPTSTSPYLLIFRDTRSERYETMSPEEKQQLLTHWNSWLSVLAVQGKLIHGHPLEPERRVVSGSRGERIVDETISDAEESIGGYFLVSVSGLDEATRIAQNCPSLPLGMSVEIRAVGECCPLGPVNQNRLVAEKALAHL